MAEAREQRLALNEALFREANERARGWRERREGDERELYHCECADLACHSKVPLKRDDYEHVRADPLHFLIVPGHQTPEIEDVVETHDEWMMIRKHDDVREVVEAADRSAG